MEDNKNINVDENKDKDIITISQADLDKKIQQAIYTNSQNEKKKYEKELEKQKSLIGLDDKQRLEQEKKDLEEQLAEYKLTNIKLDTVKVLEKRGLSADLVDFVCLNTNVDEVQANIDKLDKFFKQSVKAEVEKRLGSTTPKTSNVGFGEMTKEKLAKLPYDQQMTYLKEHPDFL
jgi:hypothetical protein